MKKSKSHSERNYRVKARCNIPSNETPEDLVKINDSSSSLKFQIQNLYGVVDSQDLQIKKIRNNISEVMNENSRIRSEILKLTKSNTRSSTLNSKTRKAINRAIIETELSWLKILNENQELTAEIKILESKEQSDKNITNRISKLRTHIEEYREACDLIEKRLEIAETLLKY